MFYDFLGDLFYIFLWVVFWYVFVDSGVCVVFVLVFCGGYVVLIWKVVVVCCEIDYFVCLF